MDADWWRDVGVLWARPLEFFPTADQAPSERCNALTRFLLYFAVLACAFTLSLSWLLYCACAVFILACSTAAVAKPPPQCLEPSVRDPFMNPYRFTIPGAGWQAGRKPACKYDTGGKLAREVVAARDRGLPPGADTQPWHTVPGANSLDPLTGSLQFAYGDWFRPGCKVDQDACRTPG